MLTLCGIAIVVATGLAAGLDVVAVVSALGRAFTQNRYVGIVWLVLPVIGLLERAGLRERAQALIARSRQATAGRVLTLYFMVRQLAAAIGLTALGGHAQMVRPLVAPMAEAAAERRFGAITPATRFLIRAHAAAADNIALFFGKDIFIAIASILLIKGFLQTNGIDVSPLQLSVWAMPTALLALALAVHVARLVLLDRQLQRQAGAKIAERVP
jgi:uncharacterized membrane protein